MPVFIKNNPVAFSMAIPYQAMKQFLNQPQL
jgi:hypothetical protein